MSLKRQQRRLHLPAMKLLALALLSGCAAPRPVPAPTAAQTIEAPHTRAASPMAGQVVASSNPGKPAEAAPAYAPAPPVAIQQVSLHQPEVLTTPQPAPPPPGMQGVSAPTPQQPASGLRGVPLNLVSALAATDSRNPQVEYARWRVHEAYAQAERANVLWLPHLRVGMSYNRHEGAIQDVAGNVFDTSRGGYYAGFGPHSVGQGSPAVPGLLMNFHAVDAIFQPKIANSAAQARSWGAQVSSSEEMLRSALLYLELLKAEEEAEIAREVVANTQRLVELTGSYARAGQGLESDFDRAKTELSLRQTDLLRSQEATQVASARLAIQLRLDPTEPILVQEPVALPIQLLEPNQPVADLVTEGLSQRPELSESRWLVSEATERLKREKYAPLLPSMLLGISYGGLGGGLGSDFSSTKDRFDADAIAYWELRNFGLGDRAARKEAGARVEQSRWREVAMLDRVAGEIIEAHARVVSRSQQIVVAERGVAAAEDSFRRNWSRIENDQGLPIETLQAIQALNLARRDYLRTVIDYNTAQFELLRAIGGGSPRFLAATAGR